MNNGFPRGKMTVFNKQIIKIITPNKNLIIAIHRDKRKPTFLNAERIIPRYNHYKIITCQLKKDMLKAFK